MPESYTLRGPDQDAIAAALAAVQQVLADEQAALPTPTQRAAWRAAALLGAQGFAPARNGAHAYWSATARLRREAHWSEGLL